MKEYHKIQTVFKREEKKPCRIIEGDFSLPEFDYLKNDKWVFTEKVDGTNIRVIFRDGQISFGGKTEAAQIPATLVERLRILFPNADRFVEVFNSDVCFYGEGYGEKIQSGGKYISGAVDFVLFDVLIGSWWLRRADVEDVAGKFGLRCVPIVGVGTLPQMVETCRDGFKSHWGDFTAEGIVARPEVELFSRKGERIITKLKHKDFAQWPVKTKTI